MNRRGVPASVSRLPAPVGAAAVFCALAAAAVSGQEQPFPVQTLNDRTYWFANSFGGKDHKWFQLGVEDLFVFPDGRVVTNTTWDEAGRAIGFYKDGDVSGGVQDGSALTGGLAVTADDRFIFALRSERKRGESDPFWFGVARYTLDGKIAKWPGGEGRMGNVLFFHPPAEKGGRQLAGVAARGGEVFLADPVSRKIKVHLTSDMSFAREFALTPETETPGKVVFDQAGCLWVAQGEKEMQRVRKYSARGEYLGKEIADAGRPSALAFDAQGLLLTADNGPRQQVRWYDVSEKPVLKKTFGAEGGVWAGDTPGLVAPDRFCNLTGVGVDGSGRLYVGTNGHSGAKLQAFDAAGKHLWTLEGLEFVDSADLDPAEDVLAFSKDSCYQLDYGVPTGSGWPHAGWQHKAWTVNPFKYPNDPRLHIRQEGVKVFRKDGKRFFVCMFGDAWTTIYRFEGFTAVPAAMFSKGGPDFPPGNPVKGKAWMWVDRNGDGDFQREEFTAIADGGLDVFRAQFVDDDGTYWLGEQGARIIHRFPVESVSEKGVPLYSTASRTKVDLAALAPDVQKLRDIKYVPATATMYLAVYSKERPYVTNWCAMAREVRRYENWSGRPSLAATLALPYDEPTNVLPIAMAVAGDYLFVTFLQGGEPTHRATGEVFVYRLRDQALIGALRPGAEVGFQSGWIDFQTHALNVRRRKDGTYVVLAEEDACAKILLYQWKPAAPEQGRSSPPASLTATVGADRVMLEWPRGAGAETYTVLRAAQDGGPFAPLARGLCRTTKLFGDTFAFLDTDVQEGKSYRYTVCSANVQGESAPSAEVTANLGAVENVFPAVGFEEDAVGALPKGWTATAGTWAVTDETAFGGKKCLKGSYERHKQQPLGPSLTLQGKSLPPGRYHVEIVIASDKPAAGVEAGTRSPRTHLLYGGGKQDIIEHPHVVEFAGERNGRKWFRIHHVVEVAADPAKTVQGIQIDLIHPHGSDKPDPTTVWVDDVRMYRYSAVHSGKSKE